MFFASIGKPEGSGVEVFSYFLAEKLGRTLGEIQAMPHAEYVGWQSYFKVQQQQDELGALRARHG